MKKSVDLIEARSGVVVKANDLIQKSRFNLSLQQQKVILYLISQIKPWDNDFKLYNFSIPDFCRVIGLDTLGGKDYKALRDAITDIASKKIWLQLEDGRLALLSWIEKAYITPDKGTIDIRLDSDMKPYLLHLKENFTRYELIFTLHFKSKYSVRLYELVKSIHFNELKEYKYRYSLAELKGLLDCDTIYSDYKSFRKRVLDVAVNEINLYSDKNVSYESIKDGRKITDIEFTISSKDVFESEKIRSDIQKDLGIDPDQLTLWDKMEQKGLV